MKSLTEGNEASRADMDKPFFAGSEEVGRERQWIIAAIRDPNSAKKSEGKNMYLYYLLLHSVDMKTWNSHPEFHPFSSGGVK